MGCLWMLICVAGLIVLALLEKIWKFLTSPFRTPKEKPSSHKQTRQRPGEWVDTNPQRKKIIPEDEGEYIDYTEVDE